MANNYFSSTGWLTVLCSLFFNVEFFWSYSSVWWSLQFYQIFMAVLSICLQPSHCDHAWGHRSVLSGLTWRICSVVFNIWVLPTISAHCGTVCDAFLLKMYTDNVKLPTNKASPFESLLNVTTVKISVPAYVIDQILRAESSLQNHTHEKYISVFT